MSNGARQIRVLFEKDSKTWSEMKDIVANILGMVVSDLEFRSYVNLASLDEEDDGSTAFVNRLVANSCLVQNSSFIASIENQLMERKGEQSVTVKLLHGERFTFAMNFLEDTVGDLKRCLEMKLGILSMQQKLIFANCLLADDSVPLGKISGLNSESEIIFVYRMLDGVMPQVSAREAIFEYLAPLSVYDATENELRFTSRPFLFRTQV